MDVAGLGLLGTVCLGICIERCEPSGNQRDFWLWLGSFRVSCCCPGDWIHSGKIGRRVFIGVDRPPAPIGHKRIGIDDEFTTRSDFIYWRGTYLAALCIGFFGGMLETGSNDLIEDLY
jgi:hypothetical protein